MSITTCATCGNSQCWNWEEAFDKFGFGDGDGIIMTEAVAQALRAVGYVVTQEPWGSHNVIIRSIRSSRGKSLIPTSTQLGYDDPREYLPKRIIKLLDKAFSEGSEVEP